ncbi:glycoside hydrolase family 113 [Flavobacterium soyangense]|uniref:Glycoside hydrolase n=1 Tax=Flavobacterium soyangense TaxID=2023265 RepID=A0A930UE09_9FLAO|nr:glycoside hydrolase [Flavobacterium soyangense]MBF2709601.1 glycoside hydrolase [Flavobacterium soyangense]
MKKTILLLIFMHCFCFSQGISLNKIKGVNFVSPKNKSKLSGIDNLKNINSNWIAICPFSFLNANSSKIEYNSPKNWYGDTEIGMISAIKKAKETHLKILLKPHYWVNNIGWAGDFDLSGKTMNNWEENYKNHLLYLARIADSLDVEMLSIGTELKTYTSNHPKFFENLIREIRKVYKGKLTYAANWDEYEHIKFWDKLDYIGIDGYFPLSDKKTPQIEDLEPKWKTISMRLKLFSEKYMKKIIFTEYGYRSVDFAANKQWEFEKTANSKNINLKAQENAYSAFYNTIWQTDFVAGGFVWKWYDENAVEKELNSDYSPQNKPVQKIINKWYSKN